jgi:hypothetical protein
MDNVQNCDGYNNLGSLHNGHYKKLLYKFHKFKVKWNTRREGGGGKCAFPAAPLPVICYGGETQLYVNVIMKVTCVTVGGRFTNLVTNCDTTLLGSINHVLVYD